VINRFVDIGLDKYTISNLEYWINCPNCKNLAKIILVTNLDYNSQKVICIHCSYQKILANNRSVGFDHITFYHDTPADKAKPKGGVEVRLSKSCLSCRSGQYIFSQKYLNTRLVPKLIGVECNNCYKKLFFDASQYKVNPILSDHLNQNSYTSYSLYLKTPTSKGQICAYNPQHLELLKAFILADLREKKFSNTNRSYFSRLPAWIKSSRNRKDVLKAISRLEDKLKYIELSA
jgi:hypothetical protein